MDTATRLRQANAVAQLRFRAMFEAETYPDPDAPETRSYIAAERLVDSILVDAQWEKAKAELDRLIAADPEYAARLAANDAFAEDLVAAMNADDLADGEHFVGVGR